MRLLEAIVDANHRALSGDAKAGVRPSDFANSLPVIALTCIDPRLNRFFPGVLGLPEDQFIWQRNAGNIITSSLSSTMRSMALACAVKEGREIAIIGHTDCKIRQTTITTLIDRFKALGIQRNQLPENLTEYFGVFASEQQNVIRGVDFVRGSSLISSAIPVHGLMVDIENGRLEWVVNGYEVLSAGRPPASLNPATIGAALNEFSSLQNFNIGEMKFPQGQIGDVAIEAEPRKAEAKNPGRSPAAAPPPPPPIGLSAHVPIPPPISGRRKSRG